MVERGRGRMERGYRGSIQEEATYLGVSCLTARPNTERPVTSTHGTNQLVVAVGRRLCRLYGMC